MKRNERGKEERKRLRGEKKGVERDEALWPNRFKYRNKRTGGESLK